MANRNNNDLTYTKDNDWKSEIKQPHPAINPNHSSPTNRNIRPPANDSSRTQSHAKYPESQTIRIPVQTTHSQGCSASFRMNQWAFSKAITAARIVERIERR